MTISTSDKSGPSGSQQYTPPGSSLVKWFVEVAAPFWATEGFDRQNQSFVERMHADGRPDLPAPRRTRVQARQIFAMATAAALGADRDCASAFEAALGPFASRARTESATGWVHLVAPDGTVLDATRDLYDQAFALLALGTAYKATQAPEWDNLAEASWAWIDAHMRDPRTGHGFFEVADPLHPARQPRRQNPHMHLLEACLALYDATGREAWLARAREMTGLFHARFFDPETGSLVEFLDDNLLPLADDRGSFREPGHHFEWVWLLHSYRRLSGDKGLDAAAVRLWQHGCRHGIETDAAMPPGIFDGVDARGSLVTPSKRVWPQCEALRAALVTGSPAKEAKAVACLAEQALFSLHLRDSSPLWRENPARNGQWPDDAPVPASTLYHLAGAARQAAVSRCDTQQA